MEAEQGIADKLLSRVHNAEERVQIYRMKYRCATEQQTRAASALMVATIGQRSTGRAFLRLRMVNRRMHDARRELSRAQADEFEATKRYAAFCQGVLT